MRDLLITDFAFLPNLNGFEIVAILFVILLLFGAKRLPELSRSLGKSIREFKKATNDVQEEIKSSIEDTPVQQKTDTVKTEESKSNTPSS